MTSAGTLWSAAIGQGVVALEGGTWTQYTAEDDRPGLPAGDTYQVVVAPDGSVWVPVQDAGIARFDGTAWTTYTTADGLLDDDAVVAVAADGTVWAVHRRLAPFGLSKFDGSAWTAFPLDSLGAEQGHGLGLVVDDGIVWMLSGAGLLGFDESADEVVTLLG